MKLAAGGTMVRKSDVRRGTVLIIVAAICALLAMLAMTFVIRMRSDAEESEAFLQQMQARIMLSAALHYIQESSRMGWADLSPNRTLSPRSGTPANDQGSQIAEGFGWVDVRDGKAGPRDRFGNLLYAHLDGVVSSAADTRFGYGPQFPAIGGKAERFEMYRWRVPPRAIKPIMYPNPVAREPVVTQSRYLAQEVGYKYLDQQPYLPSLSGSSDGFAAWVTGDESKADGDNLNTTPSWFRLYRLTADDCQNRHFLYDRTKKAIPWTPGVFLITCGSGATRGFKDWDEVVAARAVDQFANDRAMYESLRLSEVRLWFLCEWRPAIGYDTIYHFGKDSYFRFLQGTPFGGDDEVGYNLGQAQMLGNSRHQGGTFAYIERLREAPDGVPW